MAGRGDNSPSKKILPVHPVHPVHLEKILHTPLINVVHSFYEHREREFAFVVKIGTKALWHGWGGGQEEAEDNSVDTSVAYEISLGDEDDGIQRVVFRSIVDQFSTTDMDFKEDGFGWSIPDETIRYDRLDEDHSKRFDSSVNEAIVNQRLLEMRTFIEEELVSLVKNEVLDDFDRELRIIAIDVKPVEEEYDDENGHHTRMVPTTVRVQVNHVNQHLSKRTTNIVGMEMPPDNPKHPGRFLTTTLKF